MQLSRSTHPHFPVTGRSPWVIVLRAALIGGIGTLGILGFVLGVFRGGGLFELSGPVPDFTARLIVGGVAAALAVEYLFLRFGLVPRFHDYAHYRVYQHKVEFYPLTRSGLGASHRPQSIPLSAYKGVSVVTALSDTNLGGAAVYLVHVRRNRTLRLAIFRDPADAGAYAAAFAESTQVPLLPWEDSFLVGAAARAGGVK